MHQAILETLRSRKRTDPKQNGPSRAYSVVSRMGSGFVFNAFSLREPVSTSLENALVNWPVL
jgi:hypothetical protein